MQTAKLLVVDDDENNRDMLSRRLLRRGYSVATAEDGQRALDLIQPGTFDLVLLDVMMPNISGIEVLKTVRTRFAATELPIIMATAKTDREDIVEALNLGANDYVTKPIDFAVALARIEAALAHKRAVDQIVALEKNLKQQNEELAIANRRMKRDLALAARLQHELLPKQTPSVPGARAAWVYEPCDELGGDILNVFKLGPTHIGLYLADVSGHGVPAALLSVTLSRVLATVPDGASLVHRATHDGIEPASPHSVLCELNRRFPMSDTNSQYFTMLYGVLDLAAGTLRYVNAGHPPMLLIPSTGEPRFIESEAFAVGWMEDPGYEELALDLCAGDRLYIYSDGITEASNENGDEFSRQRVIDILLSQRDADLNTSLQTLVRSVAEYRGNVPQADDISALAIDISNAANPETW